jgi:ribosome hibernation promoting factor
MILVFTARQAHLTRDIRDLAAAKLQKLERLLGDILHAHVILKREKHRLVAEIVLRVKRRRLTAQGEGVEFPEALGACADKLLAQARREADRRHSRRKGRGTVRRAGLPPADQDGRGAPGGDGTPPYVDAGRVTLRAMTVEEALLSARDEEHQVLIFRNTASRQVAIFYKRPDGRYALLEAED